jgi:hypothetical protein
MNEHLKPAANHEAESAERLNTQQHEVIFNDGQLTSAPEATEHPDKRAKRRTRKRVNIIVEGTKTDVTIYEDPHVVDWAPESPDSAEKREDTTKAVEKKSTDDPAVPFTTGGVLTPQQVRTLIDIRRRFGM